MTAFLRLGAVVERNTGMGFVGRGSLLDYLGMTQGPGPYTAAQARDALQTMLGARAVAGSVRTPGLWGGEGSWPHIIKYTYGRAP